MLTVEELLESIPSKSPSKFDIEFRSSTFRTPEIKSLLDTIPVKTGSARPHPAYGPTFLESAKGMAGQIFGGKAAKYFREELPEEMAREGKVYGAATTKALAHLYPGTPAEVAAWGAAPGVLSKGGQLLGKGLTKLFPRAMVKARKLMPTFLGKSKKPITTPPKEAVEDIVEKKTKILQELEIPEDFPTRQSLLDPMGVTKKRLALPGEKSVDIIEMPRMSGTDPMGVLGPKKIRVVPASQPLDDALLHEVSPEGARKLALSHQIAVEEILAKPKPATKKVLGRGKRTTKTPSEKAYDNVTKNVMEGGEDYAVYLNGKQLMQVETELFDDPKVIVEAMGDITVTKRDIGMRYFQFLWEGSRDALKNIHPLGMQIGKRIDEAFVVGDLRTGKVVKALREVFEPMKGDPKFIENFVQVMEGKTSPINGLVKRAALTIRGMTDQLANESANLGIKIKRLKTGITVDWVPRTNYYPHFHDVEKLLKNTPAREKAIEGLMKAKKIGRQEAATLLDRIAKDHTRIYGPLEIGREIPLPGYSRNAPDVFESYFTGALRRIEMARQLGPNNEIAGKLVAGIPEGMGRTIADAGLQVATGKTEKGAVSSFVANIDEAIVSTLTPMFMGLSAIVNSFQGVLGAVSRTTVRSAVHGFWNAWKGMSKQEAKETGVLLHRFADLFGKQASQTDFFKKNWFTRSEEFSRVVMKGASDDYLKKYIEPLIKSGKKKDLLMRELEYFGLNVDKVLRRGHFTEDEINKVGIKLVELTQGRFERSSLPILADIPFGKTLFHLRSFDVLWFKFVKDYIGKEFARGNVKPLFKLVGGGIITGEVTADIWSFIQGRFKDRPQDFTRFLENMSFAGTLGIMSFATEALLQGDNKAVERAFSPPARGFVVEAGEAITGLTKLKFAPAVKFLGRRVAVPAAIRLGGLPAGIATRVLTERTKKSLQEKQKQR